MSHPSFTSTQITSIVNAMNDDLIDDFIEDPIRLNSWLYYVELRFMNCPRFDAVVS